MNMRSYILFGIIFALAGEIFDNFIVNHRPFLILPIILPVYLLFFFVMGKMQQRFETPVKISLLGGLIGLILIENLILQKFTEPWPIQIFMFSYWTSITSYPFVVFMKKYRNIFISLGFAVAAAVVTFSVTWSVFLSLALLQFIFWISSAINNIRFLSKAPKRSSRNLLKL